MIKLFVISLLISLLFISHWAINFDKPIQSLCETTVDIRKCPKDLGRIFLPRTYSARAIYVGYSRDQIHLDFLDSLIQEISKLDSIPKLNILIPSVEESKAHETLHRYFNKAAFNFINLIPVASKEAVWAQDYLEILFDTNTGQSEVVDLPYYDREGENVPTSIALACQKDLIPQADFKTEVKPGNGDYGGNIEPITSKILSVGTNLTNETYKVLQSITNQEIVEVNVDWLETGHVDELLTTLPYNKNAAPCDQALLTASPKLALSIIENTSVNLKEEKNPNIPFYDDTNVWEDYYHCLYPKNKAKIECLELKKANETYQQIIDQSVEKIQKLMVKNHGSVW